MKFVLISVMGGILGLDRVCVQIMVSRPIVTAPLIGLVLGDLYTGLIVGALVELLWIDRLPVGTCLPPNDFLVSLLVVASSILAGQELGHKSRELVAFSTLIFIPFGYLGQRMDGFIIRSNGALAEGALQDAQAGEIEGICRKHLTGLAKVFLAYVAFISLALPGGVFLIVSVFPLLPAASIRALTMTCLALPVLGAAAALHTINLKGAVPTFCAFFLVVSLIVELFRIF